MASFDITACEGVFKEFTCPLKTKCFRHQVYNMKRNDDDDFKSVFTDNPYDRENDSCDYFIDTREIE